MRMDNGDESFKHPRQGSLSQPIAYKRHPSVAGYLS